MYDFQKKMETFLLSAILIYEGFYYWLTHEQRDLVFTISVHTHIITILLAIPSHSIRRVKLWFLQQFVI
jgi:hypothetical protein